MNLGRIVRILVCVVIGVLGIAIIDSAALADEATVTATAGTTSTYIGVPKFAGKLNVSGGSFSGSLSAGMSSLSLSGTVEGDQVSLSGNFSYRGNTIGPGRISDFGVKAKGRIVNGRFEAVLDTNHDQAIGGPIVIIFPPSFVAAQAAALAPPPAAPATAASPVVSAPAGSKIDPAAAKPAPATAAPPAKPAATGATSASTPPPPATPAPKLKIEPIDDLYVAVKPAKVREKPDVEAARIKTFAVGETVVVIGKVAGQNWYLVGVDDKPLGYVLANQLAAQAETTKPAPAPATPAPAVAAATASPAAAAPKSGLPPEAAGLDFGRYHALIIGNDAYRSLPALSTAVADARAVAKSLKEQYGFDVVLLTNATRSQILTALAKLRQKLAWDDNLLIYYAGHGSYDDASERGYWLPVDAAPDDPGNWLSNADITDMLKAIQAKHVLVVADSCYSGTLTRSANTTMRDADYLQRIVQKKARTVLTSGGMEPVADVGGAGHSVFAQAFLAALRDNDGALDGQALFAKVREPVVLSAPQTPEYANLRFAGHDGGDFIFVRR